MEGVLVLGHPYVDVWQAIKPKVVGLDAWPVVPRGEDIKIGTLARMAGLHATPEDVGLGWAKSGCRARLSRPRTRFPWPDGGTHRFRHGYRPAALTRPTPHRG